jgi:hypothetical protein
MIKSALEKEEGLSFKTDILYLESINTPRWGHLDPGVRKSIGRRFRSAVDKYEQLAKIGDKIIKFSGTNINNAAVYCTQVKS